MTTTNIPGRPPIELPAFYEQFAWYYPNCEMQTKAWFVAQAQRDWVYFDCGANIGYYSILFSQLSPDGHIHAIEPTTTADMLEANLAHHHVANATVHRVAVGQHSGHREDRIFRIWGQPAETQPYEFTTIDDLAISLNLSRLDCLKIDVDSFDFEVLLGAEKTLARFDPWLVVELNHALAQRGQNNMAALTWLAARGYDQALVLENENFVLRRSVKQPLPPAALAFTLHLPTST